MNIHKQLPTAYQKIYDEFYLDYALSSTRSRKLASLLESWYHRKVSRVRSNNTSTILEIGAGSLSHVGYETAYIKYDVVEPKEFLLESANPIQRAKISNAFLSLKDVPSENRYSKIISIACLEHVDELESHLVLIKRLLADRGLFVVAIPAEGELLWWLGWRLTTGLSFWMKYKLDYGVIMKYEHVNSAAQIISAIRRHFCVKEVKSFPFAFKNFRLYITLTCALV